MSQTSMTDKPTIVSAQPDEFAKQVPSIKQQILAKMGTPPLFNSLKAIHIFDDNGVRHYRVNVFVKKQTQGMAWPVTQMIESFFIVTNLEDEIISSEPPIPDKKYQV